MAMKFKSMDTTPDVEKLFDMIFPSLGYTSEYATGDVFDNSADADATEIILTIIEAADSAQIDSLVFADNGKGMDAATLQQACRFAGTTPHAIEDLGKYGMGGTAASFFLAQTKRILTKAVIGALLGAQVNIKGRKNLSFHNIAEFIPINEECENIFYKFLPGGASQESGTVIYLTNIRTERLEVETAALMKNRLLKFLSESFRPLIDAGLKITVQVVKKGKGVKTTDVVTGYDPLYRDHPECLVETGTETIQFKGSSIDFNYSLLRPRECSRIDRERGRRNRGGDESKAMLQDTGAYLIRGRRQIVGASTLSGLWGRDPQLCNARFEIIFTSELDDHFGATAQKNKINLSAELKEALRPLTKKLKKRARLRWQTPAKKNSQKAATVEDREIKKIVDPKNAGSVGVPKRKPTPNPAGGRGPDKGKRAAKKNPGTGTNKPYKKIRTSHVSATSPGAHPYWYDFDNNGEIVIWINDAHPFIREFYTQASDETQTALLRGWLAGSLAEHKFYETDTADHLSSYKNEYANSLTAICVAK